jgi:glycine betaine/proline transport system substrate-binding protein
MLTEPTYDPAKYVMVQPSDDPDWYEKSMVASKDALKKVQIAWSNSLRSARRRLRNSSSAFELTADDVSNFAYEISGKGRDPAEVAKEWMEANPSVWTLAGPVSTAIT